MERLKISATELASELKRKDLTRKSSQETVKPSQLKSSKKPPLPKFKPKNLQVSIENNEHKNYLATSIPLCKDNRV